MPDFLSPGERSSAMARIRAKGTTIELRVRSLLHKMGYRFRLHAIDLPGKPDIILPRYKTVVFVNGCFWHQHQGCAKSKRPSTRTDFWNKKLDNNLQRDEKNTKLLRELGWRVIIVWECETRNTDRLAQVLKREIEHTTDGNDTAF